MDEMVFDVEINKEEKLPNGELSKETISICCFCQKQVDGTTAAYRKHLSIGHGSYYCPFCLRNNHHHKNAHNNLLMSFKSVFGYYHQVLSKTSPREIWLSEIVDCIKLHEIAGLTNPLFKYDQETMIWFVDFNRVGKGRGFGIEDVLDTTSEILDAVYLKYYLPTILHYDKYWEKYTKAIELFYTQRQRPLEKRILCPTFKKCMNSWQAEKDLERISEFELTDIAYY